MSKLDRKLREFVLTRILIQNNTKIVQNRNVLWKKFAMLENEPKYRLQAPRDQRRNMLTNQSVSFRLTRIQWPINRWNQFRTTHAQTTTDIRAHWSTTQRLVGARARSAEPMVRPNHGQLHRLISSTWCLSIDPPWQFKVQELHVPAVHTMYPSINMRCAQMETHTKLLIFLILSCLVCRLVEFRLK